MLLWLACEPKFEEIPVESGGAVRSYAATDDLRKDVFVLGDEMGTPYADYLFVLDSSPSTRRIVDALTEGFAALAKDGVFPERSRIAVTNMVPADPRDLALAHPGLDRPDLSAKEPGFGRLIDRAGIARYREQAPRSIAARFVHDGCDAWFAPSDVDDHGVPCIVANTQPSRSFGPLEAGLTAFGQLLQRNAGQATFRPGAAVNVIFVSDTHDPGLDPFRKNGTEHPKWAKGAAELEATRPTYEALRQLVERDNVVASLRLHAIAPEEECVERWMDIDGTYFDEVAASHGEMLDICGAGPDDYADFLRRIARSPVDRPVLPFGRPVSDVESVREDGWRVGWSLVSDRQVVVPGTEMPDTSEEIEVIYRPMDSGSILSR